MAIMRDIMRGIMRDIMRGVMAGLGGISRIFYAPLDSSLIPVTAVDGTYTFTRNDTDATVTDFEGLVKDVTANEARFVGARRVENLVVASEDFTNAGWTKSNTTATADQLTATGGNATTLDAYTAIAGDYVFSVELKRVSGTGNIQIAADNGTYTTVTLTTIYQRFSVQQTVAAGAKNAGIRIVTNGDVINARKAQLELVEGQADQNPSDYVSVGLSEDHGSNADGVKYFNYENGNTVTSNVVTDANGAAIADATLKGVLIEEARTNVQPESQDLTQWTPIRTQIDTVDVVSIGREVLYRMEDGASATFGQHRVSSSLSLGSTGAVTFSCLAIAGELDEIQLREDFDGTGERTTIFDLTTGGTRNVNANHAPFSEEISPGLWRVGIVTTGTAGARAVFLNRVNPGDSYTGTQGEGLWVGAIQVEEGAFATSYIPTAGAAATRNVEALSYPNTNIEDAEGTLAVGFTPNGSTAQYVAAAIDRALVGVRGSNIDVMYVDDVSGEVALADGTSVTTITAMPSLVAGTKVNLAGRWSAITSLMRVGQDGTEDEVAFDGSMNKSTALRIGYSGANRASGSYKDLSIYDGAVDDVTFTGVQS